MKIHRKDKNNKYLNVYYVIVMNNNKIFLTLINFAILSAPLNVKLQAEKFTVEIVEEFFIPLRTTEIKF